MKIDSTSYHTINPKESVASRPGRVREVAYKVAAGRRYSVIARSRKGRSGSPRRGSGGGAGTRTGS